MMFAHKQDPQAPAAQLFKTLVLASAQKPQSRDYYGYSSDGQALLMLSQISDPKLPTVMIVAGTHGDEIAGIEAAAKFWINEAHKYVGAVNLIYYPCVNPDGYNAGTRLTSRGHDINREFYFETTVPEARSLMSSMHRWGERVDFLLHLHEDNPSVVMDIGLPDDPIGSYLYLHGEPDDYTFPIAGRIINHWEERGHTVHKGSTLYGAEVTDGVIHCREHGFNQNMREIALLDNLVTNGEKCMSITVETLTSEDLNKRIAMQFAAIETAVQFLIKSPRLDQCYLSN